MALLCSNHCKQVLTFPISLKLVDQNILSETPTESNQSQGFSRVSSALKR